METNKLYHSIGEVAEMLGEAPSVLRFWETEFDCIRPVKNRRGSRSYTEHDIDLLRRIKYLTRDCGYTLEGAREQMRQRPLEDRVHQSVPVREVPVQRPDPHTGPPGDLLERRVGAVFGEGSARFHEQSLVVAARIGAHRP